MYVTNWTERVNGTQLYKKGENDQAWGLEY